MAAEKQRSQSGNQSIVDQDAAITAYLDGLLRDPEQDDTAPVTRSRKTPGLKVIAPETSDSTDIVAEADMTSVDAMSAAGDVEAGETKAAPMPDEDDAHSAPAVEAATDESLVQSSDQETQEVEASEGLAEESFDTVSPEQAEPDDVAPALEATMSADDMTEAAPAEVEEVVGTETVDEETMATVTEPETPAEEAEPWAWLRVGGMTLAIPSEAVVSRHADAVLDAVPGAPAQVAGALPVDGRPRLILSLANVTGARPRGDAAEVLLLGPAGLWGVVGEPADPPEAFDADAVQWRSESQKAERRGWLAGTNPAAGVAVLDVAGLRAALKGSR